MTGTGGLLVEVKRRVAAPVIDCSHLRAAVFAPLPSRSITLEPANRTFSSRGRLVACGGMS